MFREGCFVKNVIACLSKTEAVYFLIALSSLSFTVLPSE